MFINNTWIFFKNKEYVNNYFQTAYRTEANIISYLANASMTLAFKLSG